MIFRLLGQITGEICKDCSHLFSHAIVRIYRRAEVKDFPQALKPEEVKNLDRFFLGTGTVDGKGNYEVSIDGDKQDYKGDEVLVVLEIPFVQPMKGPEDKHPTLFFALALAEPKWEYTRDQRIAMARLDYCLPERITCGIIFPHFDIWAISGRVVNCDKPRIPVGGVRVTVMDADIIKDDNLGTAITDSSGKFQVYFRSIDFKQTFLSPLINIETGGAAGPDLYFLITSADGSVNLLTETRADSKKPGRHFEKSRCLCITLCVDDAGEVPTYAMVWKGVGNAFVISTESNRQNFDDDGYAEVNPIASSKKYALTGPIILTGQKPNPLSSGNPIEYRFRVSHTVSQNDLPALSEATFTKTIGVTPGLLTGVTLGTLVRYTPSLRFVQVDLSSADIDSNGWVDVRKAVNRTMLAHPLFDPSDLTDPAQFWQWSDDDAMIGLDTRALTEEEAHNTFPGLLPGQPVPPAQRYPIEKVAIRFEIRDQVTQAPLPGNGLTLNAMVVNNDNPVIRLAVKNSSGTTVICDKFKNEDVFVAYTAYHPHLEYVNIGVSSLNGSYSTSVNDGSIPFNNNPRPGIDHANNNSYQLVPRPNVTCNYSVVLSYRLLRHSGYGAESGHSPSIPFFYEV